MSGQKVQIFSHSLLDADVICHHGFFLNMPSRIFLPALLVLASSLVSVPHPSLAIRSKPKSKVHINSSLWDFFHKCVFYTQNQLNFHVCCLDFFLSRCLLSQIELNLLQVHMF